jgi:hypothetical protein
MNPKKIKFKNKIKVLNVAKLKHFYKNVEKSVEKEGDANQFNQNFNHPNEKVLTDFNDIFNKALVLMLLKSECGCCKSEETSLTESKTLSFQWRQIKLAENCCKQWRL